MDQGGRGGGGTGFLAPMRPPALGPAEEQPVAHQGETRGHDQSGNLFQALDHGALSVSLRFQSA